MVKLLCQGTILGAVLVSWPPILMYCDLPISCFINDRKKVFIIRFNIHFFKNLVADNKVGLLFIVY